MDSACAPPHITYKTAKLLSDFSPLLHFLPAGSIFQAAFPTVHSASIFLLATYSGIVYHLIIKKTLLLIMYEFILFLFKCKLCYISLRILDSSIDKKRAIYHHPFGHTRR